jgi:predicted peroxiredoxin
MDLLLILRDALANSVVGGLLLAMEARKMGREVGVLITQEALAALARGSFGWPRELAGQEMRLSLADRAAEAGVPLTARGEGRQIDVKGLVAQAREAGVALYACPIWSSLLGLEGTPSDGLESLEPAALCDLIQDARRVIGSF